MNNFEEIDNICLVAECSNGAFHHTRVMLTTFINHNKWFDGTVVLLTLKSQPLSDHNMNIMLQIYDDVVIYEIPDIDIDTLNDKVKKRYGYSNILDYLSPYAFKIKSRGNIYLSRNVAVMKDISKILSDDKLSIASSSESFPSIGSNVDGNMMFIPHKYLGETLFNSLMTRLNNSIIDGSHSYIKEFIDSNNIEVNNLPSSLMTNASIFTNNKYATFVRYSSAINSIFINEATLTNANNSRMQTYWNQLMHKSQMSLNTASKKTIIRQTLKKEKLDNDKLDKARKNIVGYKKGEWNPSLYDRSTIDGISVTITTMIWKRHDIFELWANGVHRLKRDFPEIKIDVLIAGSEGKSSKDMVEKHGFTYIEVPNSPLGAKANARLNASKQFDSDYIVLVGSDDIISSNCFLLMLCNMAKGYDEIAPMDIYYYNTVDNKAYYSHGYQNKRKGEPIAVGRCLSKSILDKAGWQLWSNTALQYLDGWSRDKIKKHRTSKLYYSCRESGVVICDIKSEVNMTPFKQRANNEEVRLDEISSEIPEIIIKNE